MKTKIDQVKFTFDPWKPKYNFLVESSKSYYFLWFEVKITSRGHLSRTNSWKLYRKWMLQVGTLHFLFFFLALSWKKMVPKLNYQYLSHHSDVFYFYCHFQVWMSDYEFIMKFRFYFLLFSMVKYLLQTKKYPCKFS